VTPYSVLMSVYFREKPECLDTALQSVFTQTVPPTQVILVKDGPLDTELDAVISSYQDR
jgi:glycosyltransferase involved in cell wall biosynthesis